MNAFGSDISAPSLGLNEKLAQYNSPSLIAVIGNPDSGIRKLIQQITGVGSEAVSKQDDQIDYHFLYHEEFPPTQDTTLPNSSRFIAKTEALKKLSFVEVRTANETGVIPVDPMIKKTEGIIFVIDATDPWSGSTWKHFINYANSHEGRICVCLNKLHLTDERDWPVLKKHLEDKIFQLSPSPIDIRLIKNENDYESILEFLENKTISDSKWEDLRTLTNDLNDSLDIIQDTLKVQTLWLENALDTSHEITESLEELRSVIAAHIEKSIENIDKSFLDKTSSIVQDISQSFTHSAYFKSIFTKSKSHDSFFSNLKEILSDAIYVEIGTYYIRTNQFIKEHALQFKEEHPNISAQLPRLQGENLKGIKIPFMLEKAAIRKEVQTVFANLDVHNIFSDELMQIQRSSNNSLKLSLLVFLAACGTGIAGFHLVALGLVVITAMSVFFMLKRRTKQLNRFYDFLNDWFLGLGPQMKAPVNLLSQNIVTHAIDSYSDAYAPILELVENRKSIMPKRFASVRKLFLQNRKFIQELIRTTRYRRSEYSTPNLDKSA